VRRWLDGNGVRLGGSDEAAEHWLIVDALTMEVHAAARNQARAILLGQWSPG
jgi:hypothetical protein